MGPRTEGISLERGTYKIKYRVTSIASKGTGLALFNEDTKEVEKLLFRQIGVEKCKSINNYNNWREWRAISGNSFSDYHQYHGHKSYSRGSVFHLSFNCPKKRKKRVVKKNHCENNKEKKSKGDKKDKVLLLLLNTESGDEKMKIGWFIDSGATTAHMTDRKDMLHSNERKIKIGKN